MTREDDETPFDPTVDIEWWLAVREGVLVCIGEAERVLAEGKARPELAEKLQRDLTEMKATVAAFDREARVQ